MYRTMCMAFAAVCLLASPLSATPPSPPVPLAVRLAKMDVVVVGTLMVQGEGKGRDVTLKVSHVLKKPDKPESIKRLKPGTELKVQPRPKGFSDQGGEGVWSLHFDGRRKDLHVEKYEFITYAREWKGIKKVLDSLAPKPSP